MSAAGRQAVAGLAAHYAPPVARPPNNVARPPNNVLAMHRLEQVCCAPSAGSGALCWPPADWAADFTARHCAQENNSRQTHNCHCSVAQKALPIRRCHGLVQVMPTPLSSPICSPPSLSPSLPPAPSYHLAAAHLLFKHDGDQQLDRERKRRRVARRAVAQQCDAQRLAQVAAELVAHVNPRVVWVLLDVGEPGFTRRELAKRGQHRQHIALHHRQRRQRRVALGLAAGVAKQHGRGGARATAAGADQRRARRRSAAAASLSAGRAGRSSNGACGAGAACRRCCAWRRRSGRHVIAGIHTRQRGCPPAIAGRRPLYRGSSASAATTAAAVPACRLRQVVRAGTDGLLQAPKVAVLRQGRKLCSARVAPKLARRAPRSNRWRGRADSPAAVARCNGRRRHARHVQRAPGVRARPCHAACSGAAIWWMVKRRQQALARDGGRCRCANAAQGLCCRHAVATAAAPEIA
eukprot:365157-Chlamydomonas_euryale.AAC.38